MTSLRESIKALIDWLSWNWTRYQRQDICYKSLILASKLIINKVEVAKTITIFWFKTLISRITYFIIVKTGDLTKILLLLAMTLVLLLFLYWGYIYFWGQNTAFLLLLLLFLVLLFFSSFLGLFRFFKLFIQFEDWPFLSFDLRKSYQIFEFF